MHQLKKIKEKIVVILNLPVVVTQYYFSPPPTDTPNLKMQKKEYKAVFHYLYFVKGLFTLS